MAKTGDRGRARARTAPAPALAALDFALDRVSPVPLYHQLAQQLQAAIEHGSLAPGDLLGNEVDLSVRLGLSRPTVRQAIQSLVDKGLLVRRRGVGTQVVHSRVRRPLELSSLYDDLEAAGQGPTTQVVRNEVVPASCEVAAALGVPEGSEVAALERLRRTHGRPVALLRNYLPVSLLALDDARLESTGLYRMMRSAGITLHSARQTVGARAATPEEATRLEEREGAALLTMERTAFDDTGRAVEYGRHIYPASRYTFDFQLLIRA
ncbi:GntR family transcriptional regulator [Streptomyces dubilierae]|uniref:GntR family transcriptional regulator n=1 Tax=Streptomyces dubilierae TaxID=3075533 RepID=A0ABU2PH87_9ACTN|nr:GntR family transcriptional regulator [Streptomyces sp. DSM 41921]MDT0391523.1 GntR family transcriptional regulator [Streptomyces sp. DSM 41921]